MNGFFLQSSKSRLNFDHVSSLYSVDATQLTLHLHVKFCLQLIQNEVTACCQSKIESCNPIFTATPSHGQHAHKCFQERLLHGASTGSRADSSSTNPDLNLTTLAGFFHVFFSAAYDPCCAQKKKKKKKGARGVRFKSKQVLNFSQVKEEFEYRA